MTYSYFHKSRGGFRSVFLLLAMLAARTLTASFFLASQVALKWQSEAQAQPA